MRLTTFALSFALLTLLAQPLAAQTCDDREIPDAAWSPTDITLDDAAGFVPRRLLVMRGFWQSGPEAVLVEEPQQVAAMFDLIAGNSRVAHACGYHWALVFQDDSHRMLEHLHNKECETYRYDADEIQARLSNYFRIVETKPTHFLLDVELDPTADPSAMTRLLERSGRHVFILRNPDARFPRLRITQSAGGAVSEKDEEKQEEAIKATARQRIDRVIALLKSREQARVLEEPRDSSSQYGGEHYEVAMQATVIFPLSFDESHLKLYEKDLALPADADEMLREVTAAEPAFERPASYVITLVSREPYSKELAEAIKALSPLIRKVAPPESERMGE